MCTPSTVLLPPRPMGPMPSSLAAAKSSSSRAAITGSSLWLPSGRSTAFLASAVHRSLVPPSPTPTTVGGQGLGPASTTHSRMKRLTPRTPSAGISIFRKLMFSEPEPLGRQWSLRASLGISAEPDTNS